MHMQRVIGIQDPSRGTAWRRWVLAVVAVAAWVGVLIVNEPTWDRIVYGLLGLPEGTRWTEAVHFFVVDTTKILVLLAGIIFAVAVLRSFVTLERTRAVLGGRREGLGNVAAAGLGVVTPFCSCSAVPAFIGFVTAGVPLGITLSFLIASPMVNEVALVMLFGLFGWKVAFLYVGFGLAVAVGAGYLLGRVRPERWVEPFVFDLPGAPGGATPDHAPSWSTRLAMGREEVRTIIRKIWPYLLVGIGLGAVVHGWAPQDLFTRIAGPGNPLAVPAAVLLGIPLYSNAAGIMPLVEALAAKGLAMGTVLAFMMSVVALSLPEMILLRRVLRPRLLAAFTAVVGGGIVAVGLLFNVLI
jgi:uncharacterized membrane protein YraQ (UPF0718 family)